MSTNPNLRVLSAISSNSYSAEDATDDRFYISSTLNGGALRFIVIATLRDGTRSKVSGTEFFDAMMSHFGSAVRIVVGDWSNFDPELSSNLDRFNSLTAAGIDEAQAARRTWTGRVAGKYGYTKVRIVHALPGGAKGNYSDVAVDFTKDAGP